MLLCCVADWLKWIHCPFLWTVENWGLAECGSWDWDSRAMGDIIKCTCVQLCLLNAPKELAWVLWVKCRHLRGWTEMVSLKWPFAVVSNVGWFSFPRLLLPVAVAPRRLGRWVCVVSPQLLHDAQPSPAVPDLTADVSTAHKDQLSKVINRGWSTWMGVARNAARVCASSLHVQRGRGCWSPVTPVINSANILSSSEKLNADIVVQMWTKALGSDVAVSCNLFLGVITLPIIVVAVRV